jgi:predicted XRE-type DNA-binding protein
LDRERLTVRAAHARTGIAAADFSRIRNADLRRFTLDRLIAILSRLGSRIEIKVRVRRERVGLKRACNQVSRIPLYSCFA